MVPGERAGLVVLWPLTMGPCITLEMDDADLPWELGPRGVWFRRVPFAQSIQNESRVNSDGSRHGPAGQSGRYSTGGLKLWPISKHETFYKGLP